MSTKQNLTNRATDITEGRATGNVEHARLTLAILGWIRMRDSITATTTTDERAGDEIAVAINLWNDKHHGQEAQP